MVISQMSLYPQHCHLVGAVNHKLVVYAINLLIRTLSTLNDIEWFAIIQVLSIFPFSGNFQNNFSLLLHTVFCCRHCFRIFGDRQELVSHQKENDHGCVQNLQVTQQRNVYRCPYGGCNAIFDYSWRLNKHTQIHNKPYICSFDGCSKAFGDKRNLLVHARIHDGDERCEKCNFCDKSFRDPSTLRHHIKCVHENGDAQKPFVCRRCHKGFSKRSLLKYHLLTHLPISDRILFECDHCDSSYAVKSNLNRHIKKVHALQCCK